MDDDGFGGRADRDVLESRARATPDARAVVDVDAEVTVTYGELNALVDGSVAELARRLDDSKSTVATLVGSRLEFAVLLFAALRAGHVFAPLDVRRDEETLAWQVDRVDANVLVRENATTRLADAVADCPVLPVDEVVPDASSGITASRERSVASEFTTGDPTLVLFTSGTTGRPKGVELTPGNLLANAVASAFRLGVAPDDRWLAPLPTCHMGGLAPIVRSTLYGTTVILQQSFDARATAAVVDEQDVTGLSLVPTMLSRLLEAGWKPPDALRFVLLGGAPASASLLERAERRGVPVCPSYGTTETASQVATARPATAFEQPGTVGQPLLFTDVTIVSDASEVQPPETAGEIVVSGPAVTRGYLDDDHTEDAMGPRGFHTGDLGYVDEEGRLWVAGRLDDRIVTGGENVSPSAVVDVILEIEDVTDAAVVGVPDSEWGERVGALVVTRESGPTTDVIQAECRTRLADYEVPKIVRVVDELPRTASGTVDRERAIELLMDG